MPALPITIGAYLFAVSKRTLIHVHISTTALITRNPNAVETTVGDEVILMLIESGECIGLGETGSEVWRQLASPITLPTLCERLHEIFDAPDDLLEHDLDELLENLQDHQLITLQ